MTRTIDNFLVKLDFDRAELERINTRKFWYAGIVLLLSLTALALWQTTQVWLG